MSNNVFILGAGFSKDAGIPLLRDFIEQMWEYGFRGKAGNIDLSDKQKAILREASKIIDDMAHYHRRVRFDDRNIEDVMSMLAFDSLPERKESAIKSFSAAVAETIELACAVKHSGEPKDFQQFNHEGPQIYQKFWKALFDAAKDSKEIPTIITLNYDLVLERSLFQSLQFVNARRNPIPLDSFSLNFGYPSFNDIHFRRIVDEPAGHSFLRESHEDELPPSGIHRNIEILKLHGSLSFPTGPQRRTPPNVAAVNEQPNIVPPISNKQSNKDLKPVWDLALKRLKNAKKVTLVGYSLPSTDTYMQYFLRAALGPNKDLRSVNVFDPCLYKKDDEADTMKQRYLECFSQQMEKHLIFNPVTQKGLLPEELFGTTRHFIDLLTKHPKGILF